MLENSFKVALYIRVSTDRQAKEGDSLEEQESELKKFCEFKRFRIHNIYIESGKSGGNTNRPEYQKLIKDIKKGKLNAVVVKKLDRLSRSLLDFEALMSLLREKNVEFISIKENFDTTSAMGKAMLRVALVFAQLEREQTSERLIDVLEYRASQGLYNGGVRPFGYTNVSKELVPYPKERVIVELIFAQFLDNHSTTLTAKTLNETGYRNRNNKVWDKRQIQKILQSPVYLGKVRWKTSLYQGIHQPIISEKQFQQTQHIFKNKIFFRGSKTKALLQKRLFCDHCHAPMTPSHSLNKNKIKYYYYRCTQTQSAEKGKSRCPVKQVNFKIIEKQVITTLLSLSEETCFQVVENKVYKHNESIEKVCSAARENIQQLSTQLDTLKTKKDRYLDSLISSQFATSEREKINKRIEEMELDEKQLKARQYKQEFELAKTEEDHINLTQLKKLFITFKTDQISEDYETLRTFIQTHIHKIHYNRTQSTIQFKLLPWPLEFRNA